MRPRTFTVSHSLCLFLKKRGVLALGYFKLTFKLANSGDPAKRSAYKRNHSACSRCCLSMRVKS